MTTYDRGEGFSVTTPYAIRPRGGFVIRRWFEINKVPDIDRGEVAASTLIIAPFGTDLLLVDDGLYCCRVFGHE